MIQMSLAELDALTITMSGMTSISICCKTALTGHIHLNISGGGQMYNYAASVHYNKNRSDETSAKISIVKPCCTYGNP